MGHELSESMLERIQLKNGAVSVATGWSYSTGVMLGGAGVCYFRAQATSYSWERGTELSKKQVQFSSDPQSCRTLCDPMDCSKPGFPVHHPLCEFTQTHVH